jgi:hypothetical protein
MVALTFDRERKELKIKKRFFKDSDIFPSIDLPYFNSDNPSKKYFKNPTKIDYFFIKNRFKGYDFNLLFSLKFLISSDLKICL